MMRRTLLQLLLILLTATALRADPVPAAMQGIGVDEKPDGQLPLDVKFTNELGQTVTLRDCMLPGKPMILQLSYFGCPMLCDLVSKGMLKSMEELDLNIGSDFTVVNLSFDQRETKTDAALKKKGYLDHYDRKGAGSGWRFLVGDPESVKAVTDAVGFKYKWDDATKQFAHPAVLMVITPEGRISRYLYGVDFPQRTMRLSLVEASQGKIGTTVDQLIMLCYHYDPQTGKYSMAAMDMMRVGGAMTVLVLAGVVFGWLMKERRAQRSAKTAA
jgi:protein SCO1/2